MGFLRVDKKGFPTRGKDSWPPTSGRAGRTAWPLSCCGGVVIGIITCMLVVSKFTVFTSYGVPAVEESTIERRRMREVQEDADLGSSCDLVRACKGQCGTVDACGTRVSCGACSFPSTCGGGGVDNQCGCKPATCESMERTCGFAPDGCGGVMKCGRACRPYSLSPGTPPPPPQKPYRVTYFANWAQFNPGARAYQPEDIEHDYVSHAIFAYAYIDKETRHIKNSMYNDDDDANSGDAGMWTRFVKSCKLGGTIPMLSVGGWDFSLHKEGMDIFGAIAKSATSRKAFIEHAVEFLQKYKFQGIDWWWEFPPTSQAADYVLLIIEMRAALDKLEKEVGGRYWQSVFVPGLPGEADAHFPNKAGLASAVDWLAVKTYELHSWIERSPDEDPRVFAHSPLVDPEGRLSISSTMAHWEKGGAPKAKLMMGLSLEAFVWTLKDPADHVLGALAKGPGAAESGGAKVNVADFLESLKAADARQGILDLATTSVYAYSGNQWGSYDDTRTAEIKAEFVVQRGYAGLYIWSIDMDHSHALAKAASDHLLVKYPAKEKFFLQPQTVTASTDEVDSNIPGKVNTLVASSYVRECPNKRGDHLISKSLKNKIDYAGRHGMNILYNLAVIDTGYDGMWSKQPLFKKLLNAHPEVEWFMWVDSDAFITDMKWEIPWERYKKHNMVVPGYKRCVFNETRPDWCCINAGIFLLRRCDWSIDFVNAWLEFGVPSKKWEYGKLFSEDLTRPKGLASDDQSALMYLIRHEYEKFGKYIYLEQGYDLHGYWVPLVEKFDEILANAGPEYAWAEKHRPSFITHFVGCKMCSPAGKGATYDQQKCFDNMERAFNFADNQMVIQYGLRHANLSSPILKKIPVAELKK